MCLSEPAISQRLRRLRVIALVGSRREWQVLYDLPDDEHVSDSATMALRHVEEV